MRNANYKMRNEEMEITMQKCEVCFYSKYEIRDVSSMREQTPFTKIGQSTKRILTRVPWI